MHNIDPLKEIKALPLVVVVLFHLFNKPRCVHRWVGYRPTYPGETGYIHRFFFFSFFFPPRGDVGLWRDRKPHSLFNACINVAHTNTPAVEVHCARVLLVTYLVRFRSHINRKCSFIWVRLVTREPTFFLFIEWSRMYLSLGSCCCSWGHLSFYGCSSSTILSLAHLDLLVIDKLLPGDFRYKIPRALFEFSKKRRRPRDIYSTCVSRGGNKPGW